MKLPKVTPASTKTREEVTIKIGDEPFVLDLRLLSAGEEVEVLAEAYAYAKRKGVEEPSEADAIYERGLWFATIARAAVDHDSPKDAPEPLFTSLDELEAYPLITAEHVAYLHAFYEVLVDKYSPRTLVLDTEAFLHVRKSLAEGDFRPFAKLRRGTQCRCAATLAVLVETLLAEKSRTSSISSPTKTEPTTETH